MWDGEPTKRGIRSSALHMIDATRHIEKRCTEVNLEHAEVGKKVGERAGKQQSVYWEIN